MKSSKFTGKMEKIKAKWTQVSLKNVSKSESTCEFFSVLFLLLVRSGHKRSMPIEKLGSSVLVSSILQREGKLHCSLTWRKIWSKVKKKCSRHLIYARACVNKDFVHSGSIYRTYIGQARVHTQLPHNEIL